jgi:hypothetical protein
MQMVVEVAMLYDLLDQVQLADQPDTFSWSLTADRCYSAASTYGAMFFGSSIPLGAKQIWKTAAPPRIRFFFWLVLHGRCWTADRRFRQGLQSTSTCALCDQACETMDHILIACVYSREVWQYWFNRLHLQDFDFLDDEAIAWWLRNRKRMPRTLHKGFGSLFFLVGWRIWKERNARTFDGISSQAGRLASAIQEEAVLCYACVAGNRHLGVLLAG